MSTFWTGRAYQIRCALQDIYQMPDKGLAAYRFKCLIKWIRRVKRKSRGLSFDGMRTQLYLHFGKLDFGFNIKAKIHSQPLPVWIPKLITSRKPKTTPQPQAEEAV